MLTYLTVGSIPKPNRCSFSIVGVVGTGSLWEFYLAGIAVGVLSNLSIARDYLWEFYRGRYTLP